MATVITHFVVGAGIYRFVDAREERPWTGVISAGALAMLPDVDALFMRWIPYEAPWGHRGMTHSLAFAAVVGALAALALRRRTHCPGGYAGLAATLAVVVASHGLLDALTDGGLGIALFAPFDARRLFFPVRPIPVSPITANPFQSDVVRVLSAEMALLWPPALLLATARARCPRWVRSAVLTLCALSVVVWSVRCR